MNCVIFEILSSYPTVIYWYTFFGLFSYTQTSNVVMYLLYFPIRSEFVRYDNVRFVGLQEEKKYWHFLKKMPQNLLEIINEIGCQVSSPTNNHVFYEEKKRLLRRTTVFTVYDEVQQKNITGSGKDWIEALNNLVQQLARVGSSNPAA